MAIRDIEPLHSLDQATTPVETAALRAQGVHNLRIVSESRFLDLVRRLVGEYLEGSMQATTTVDSEAPHDQKLSREYERRWESLRTRHEIGLRQIERRMDRLSRVFRKLESLYEKLERQSGGDDDDAGAAYTRAAPPGRRGGTREPDKSRLMREMLLGADETETAG